MSRPTKDDIYVNVALLVARRSTCLRRAVGCVLANKDGNVLATGYNGVARGLPHCNEFVGNSYPHACPGSRAPSGQDLDKCEAIHAEQNALLQCKDVQEIDTVYVTTSPCVTCTKLLLNTSARRIVFLEAYTHSAAQSLWERAGRVWEHYDIEGDDNV